MPKRSGKFYRQNEAEVMKKLGFKPTKNSGSGWIEKEDGQNDFLIAQLKSTDAMSIRIQQKDISTLEENAAIAHKIPCFVIQFLNNGDVFVMARPEDFPQVAQYMDTGVCQKPSDEFALPLNINTPTKTNDPTDHSVKSSAKAREKFHKEQEKERELWRKKSKRPL
jgi:hypothetical protein